MAGYQPKKARTAKEEPTIVLGRMLGPSGKPLAKCGTNAGYNRHIKLGEYACEDCKDAAARHRAERDGYTHTGRRRHKAIQHGTMAGYRRCTEGYQGAPCPACYEGQAAYQREQYAKKRPEPTPTTGRWSKPIEHGTVRGVRAHRSRIKAFGEEVAGPVCDECLAAERANEAAKRRAAGIPEQPPARCGTRSGARRHRRAGEPVCEPCLAAEVTATRTRRARAATAKEPGKAPTTRARVQECGSIQGRAKHQRAGEPLCQDCTNAYNAHRRRQRTLRLIEAGKGAACGTRYGYRQHANLGEPACPACEEAQNPAPIPAPVPECGTIAGYNRHRKQGEARCRACKDAYNAHRAVLAEQATLRAFRDHANRHGLQPCGTRAAYQRHYEHGHTPCEQCRDAFNAAHRAETPRILQPCGTRAAYARHRAAGETPCLPCETAERAHNKARAAARRAAQQASLASAA